MNDNFPKPLGRKQQDSGSDVDETGANSGNDSELEQLLNSDHEDDKE